MACAWSPRSRRVGTRTAPASSAQVPRPGVDPGDDDRVEGSGCHLVRGRFHRRLPRAARAGRDPGGVPADRAAHRPRAGRLRGPCPLPHAARPGRAAAGRHAGRLRSQRTAPRPRGRVLGRHRRGRRPAAGPAAVRQRLPGSDRPRRVRRHGGADAVAAGHRAHRAGRGAEHRAGPRAAAAVDRPRRARRRRRRGRRGHLAGVRGRDPARLPQALPRHGHRRGHGREPPRRAARHRGVRPRGRRADHRRGRRAPGGARGAARGGRRLRPGLAVRAPHRRLAARSPRARAGPRRRRLGAQP
jgi:hypothetical protein